MLDRELLVGEEVDGLLGGRVVVVDGEGLRVLELPSGEDGAAPPAPGEDMLMAPVCRDQAGAGYAPAMTAPYLLTSSTVVAASPEDAYATVCAAPLEKLFTQRAGPIPYVVRCDGQVGEWGQRGARPGPWCSSDGGGNLETLVGADPATQDYRYELTDFEGPFKALIQEHRRPVRLRCRRLGHSGDLELDDARGQPGDPPVDPAGVRVLLAPLGCRDVAPIRRDAARVIRD